MMPFIERITPDAMIDRFKEICLERHDVRVLTYILGQQKTLEWMHSIGVCKDKKLRSLIPPLPPLNLRKITAAPELQEFLWTGLVDLERIMTLYEEAAGTSAEKHLKILDFGCGCGRMSRFLNNYSSTNSIYACDVNPDHIKWCQKNLIGVQYSQNNVLPPLPYHDQMFDLVYSLSVFTHLSESTSIEWLTEMRRILKSDGVLIITIHGQAALQIIRDSIQHQAMFTLDQEQVIETINKFKEKQFIFYNYDRSTLDIAKAGEDYGNTFIYPEYIKNKWGKLGFTILDIISGGLRGWQDIVILRRTDLM